LQGEVQILLVQVDAKARSEIALQHPFAMHFEDAPTGETAH